MRSRRKAPLAEAVDFAVHPRSIERDAVGHLRAHATARDGTRFAWIVFEMYAARLVGVLALASGLAACGVGEDHDTAIASGEQALSSTCSSGSVDSFEGVEGEYARAGVTLRDEMRTLSVRAARARVVADELRVDAQYTRTVARRCTPLGCTAESGTMSFRSGNVTFEPSDVGVPRESYALLGAKGDGDVVTELCVARDAGEPFLLRRIDGARALPR